MRKIATTAAAMVLLVLVAAACGGSKSSSGTTTSTATTTGGAGTGGSATQLTGAVGPGYTISLTQNGQNVTTLKPGTYTFVVSDQASNHGFTLAQTQGGSFQKDLTSVPSEGSETVAVKLTKGKWTFYCPPHQSQMTGTFTVA